MQVRAGLPWKEVAGFVAAAAAVVAVFSCGEDGPDEPTARFGVFTGRLATTNAFIGITLGTANVVAWVCDGANGIALQFSTPRLDDGFDVTLPNRYRLAGRLNGEKVDGALSGPDGVSPFTADLARGGAGVWTATQTGEGDQRRVWIVLNDGAQQGSSVTASGVTVAPQLDTSTGKAETIQAVRSNPTGSSAGGMGQFGFGGGISGGTRPDAGLMGFAGARG